MSVCTRANTLTLTSMSNSSTSQVTIVKKKAPNRGAWRVGCRNLQTEKNLGTKERNPASKIILEACCLRQQSRFHLENPWYLIVPQTTPGRDQFKGRAGEFQSRIAYFTPRSAPTLQLKVAGQNISLKKAFVTIKDRITPDVNKFTSLTLRQT